MRPFLGAKYLPRFTYISGVCLFHFQLIVSDLWSAVMNLKPLQFELQETEIHHLKIWYFQITCGFLGAHRACSFKASHPNFSKFLAGRFGFKAVEKWLYLVRCMYFKISKTSVSCAWSFTFPYVTESGEEGNYSKILWKFCYESEKRYSDSA